VTIPARVGDTRDARGEETRQRLLAAALSAFGARGYDGVSTRELARAAGVNQAAIVYHFGGKEALYTTVADHVAAHGRAALAPLLDRGTSDPPSTRAAALTQLAAALHGLVRGLLDLADDGAAAAFVLREQTHPGPGFPPLYDGYIRPLHEHVTRLVAAATERSPNAVETVVDAHAVVGLALGFAVARATLLRRTGWEAYTPARIDQIADRVAHLACRALAGGGGRIDDRS